MNVTKAALRRVAAQFEERAAAHRHLHLFAGTDAPGHREGEGGGVGGGRDGHLADERL
mgnify:CR=1 FL=1